MRISVLAAIARILALLRKGWGYGLVVTARCVCDSEAAYPMCMGNALSRIPCKEDVIEKVGKYGERDSVSSQIACKQNYCAKSRKDGKVPSVRHRFVASCK